MPDDDHLGGARSGDPHGYGRRHRRAEEPDEQPRRRRRSMEDNEGGLSVADLVQKHTGSRANLPVPPPQPQPGGRRAMPSPPASQPTPRRARPADGQPTGHQASGRHQSEPMPRPAVPPRGRPAEAAGGPWPGPGQSSGPRAGRQPSGPLPGDRTSGRPQAGPLPGGREPASPPPASRRSPRQPSAPLPVTDFPAEPAGPPNGSLRPSSGRHPGGRRTGPADGDFPSAPPLRHPGPADGDFPSAPPLRQPGPAADDFPSAPPLRHSGPADDRASRPQRHPADGDFPSAPPLRHPGAVDERASRPQRHPSPANGDFPSAPPLRHPGPAAGDFPSNPPLRHPGHADSDFPGAPSPRHPGPVDERSARSQRHPGPAADDFPSAPPLRHPGPAADDFPSGPPLRHPGPGDERTALPSYRKPGPGPEADLPPGGRESGIRHSPNVPDEELPGPGQRSMPARPDVPGTRPPGQSTGRGPVPLPPPRRPEEDPISMTTEMEAIGEEVQKRRSIDHTLARFSAVHDELKAEEREKKSKRRKLLPWQQQDDELDRLDELVGMQTIAVPQEAVAAPEEDPEDTPPRKKKARRKDKSLRAGRMFAVVAAILVFAATGAGWGFKSWINSSTQQVDALDPNSAAIQDAAAQRGDENFLLVGSDTRAGAAAEEGVGDESEIVGARSDTVMIAHIPKSRERVVVVSFPRDLEVNRPACERWDSKTGEYTGDTDPGAEQVKINTAYQVGGPMCVTKMVQELSGLAINHFVGIDFHGFKDMVDAVDGVQVCVERPLKDEVLGTVVPQAGKNVTLTGDQALNFVRARKVEGDPTSDYGRIIRQQRFLSSLLRKAMSNEVLLDPGKLTGFIDAFSKSTFGDNIGVDQMFVLGQSLQEVDAGRVTFVTVPTVGESNENGNEELRVEDNNALFQAIRNDTPLPGETPAKGKDKVQPNAQLASSAGLRRQQQPQESTAPVDPATIKIQVLNGGNNQDGIASQTADELGDLGFQIMWVDASPERVDRTVIKYSKVKEAQAQTLAAAVPGAELVEDPAAGGALQLIIGPGFDGRVVSPTGGGEPPPKLPDLSTVNAGDVSCA